jgi:dienelactone hydrolase
MTRRLLAGVLTALVTACRPAPAPAPPPVAPPGVAAETRELSLDDGFLTIRIDIPREPPGPKPVVLSLLGERERMLEAGLAVVTHQVHWELLRPLVPAPKTPRAAPARTWGMWMLAAPTPKTVGQGYFRVISGEATRTVPRVLDTVLALPALDGRRVGIAGTSTNGFIALQAAAHDRRIRAAAVVAACGEYHHFLRDSSLAMKGEFLDLDPEYSAWLRSIEPARHPERLVHAAVLLLNGAEDVVIPQSCVRATEHALARAYGRAGVPERFRSLVLPGAGHDVSAAARSQIPAWWGRWLREPALTEDSGRP